MANISVEAAASENYAGLLCIGDPHLASRVPGFRKDDYPATIVEKLSWALAYASEHRLLPAILGDLFHWPRDIANRTLVQLLGLFKVPVIGVMGNHDCRENELAEDDALFVLLAAGRLRLLEHTGPWRGKMGGRSVIIGGTAWGQPLPATFDLRDTGEVSTHPLVIWLMHHDIRFPGYEEVGRIDPREIPGIDICINGHIHRPLDDVTFGKTVWVNPGNIARICRSDATRGRRPSVLRIDVSNDGWQKQLVGVPCRAFEDVFHAREGSRDVPAGESPFIRGLAELESLKTDGTGLHVFLENNLAQFGERVAAEIRDLANEEYPDGRI